VARLFILTMDSNTTRAPATENQPFHKLSQYGQTNMNLSRHFFIRI
jgi:hypothetical protein